MALLLSECRLKYQSKHQKDPKCRYRIKHLHKSQNICIYPKKA